MRNPSALHDDFYDYVFRGQPLERTTKPICIISLKESWPCPRAHCNPVAWPDRLHIKWIVTYFVHRKWKMITNVHMLNVRVQENSMHIKGCPFALLCADSLNRIFESSQYNLSNLKHLLRLEVEISKPLLLK